MPGDCDGFFYMRVPGGCLAVVVIDHGLVNWAFDDGGFMTQDVVSGSVVNVLGKQVVVMGPGQRPILIDSPEKHSVGDKLKIRIKTPAMGQKMARGSFLASLTGQDSLGAISLMSRPLEIFLNQYAQIPAITNNGDVQLKHPKMTLATMFDWQSLVDKFLRPVTEPCQPIVGGRGNFFVEPSEALTVVDVNTTAYGKVAFEGYTDFLGGNLKDPIVFNETALNSIMTHLHLLRVGGLILIDLPRMKAPQDREQIKLYARSIVKQWDRQVLGFTKGGLLEILAPRRAHNLFEVSKIIKSQQNS